MTLDFCKPWSDEDYKLFLDAIRKRKTEYCKKHGLPIPAFDKVEDFYVEAEMMPDYEPAARARQSVTIKDFKVGQTVYILVEGRCERDKPVTTATVTKVGRKYVTIDVGWWTQFKESAKSAPYFVEHTDYGAHRLLFPSREAADDYREREELKTWVRTAAGWDKIDRYTLAQLRAAKKILEGNNSE